MNNFFDRLYRFFTEDVNGFLLSVQKFFKEHSWLSTLFTVFFVVIAVFLLLFLIYRKLKGRYLERLIYKREFSVENVYAGETVTLTETIYNPTFFPLFRVDVEEYFLTGLWIDGARPAGKTMSYEEQEPILSRFTLFPFMQTKRHHTVFCETRGHHKINTVRIYRKNDPLFVEAPAEIFVYPKYTDPVIRSYPVSCLLGEYTSQRRLIQDPFSFSGIRDYRFGDPMNIINYKATSKHPVWNASDIMVNMRDYCTGRLFMVYLNFHMQNASQKMYENYNAVMEYGLSTASAVIRDAVANGCKVGFAGNCPTETDSFIRYPMQSSDEHYKQVMRGFASLRITDGQSIKQLLQWDIDKGLNNAEIIFLTTYMDDEIDDRLRILKQYSNAVTVIHIGEGDIDIEQ